ncbi:uncharacterized protein LOC108652562 isoform X2 [Drosophila navojoa]|nr:uncharacterized protein LOC108652562 isoform X2 [Drosophila navojoa]
MSTDAFQARHNHFIDAIFSRINRIVADNYDPFVVRLAGRSATATPTYGNTVVKSTTKTKGTTSHKTTSHKKLKNTRSEPRMASSTESVKLQQQLTQLQTELGLKVGEQRTGEEQQTQQAVASGSGKAETRTVFNGEQAASKVSPKKSSVGQQTTHKHSPKKTGLKAGSGSYNQPAGVGASKAGSEVEKLQKAEGSLSGLASLKRVGNVKVISDAEGRNSTIKARFTLGPLTLRVEKSFKRGSVRNVKSATARTNEMIGRIKFSVLDDRATLMSIKVQQPKQVEVESKDNHDRTREFVWRRTPKIAKLVNEKLKLAAESLFTPQGVEVVRL